MKLILIIILTMACTLKIQSQTINDSILVLKQNKYLKISKDLNTVGKVFTITSGSLFFIGIIGNGLSDDGSSGSNYLNIPNVPPQWVITTLYASLYSIVLSIPFYISSGIYKRKTLNIRIKPEVYIPPMNQNVNNTSYAPMITLRIRF